MSVAIANIAGPSLAIGSLVLISLPFVYFLWRNQRVCRVRKDVLRSILAAGERDIESGLDFKWRYEAFDKVSYESMLYRFWKSVRPEEFWTDLEFMR